MTFEWQFGGWLGRFPPLIAWMILSSFAVAGLVLAVWLYRHTLRELRPATRLVLTILRGAILLVVLLCLANPQRVESLPEDNANRQTLAVLVDRSDSMKQPDHRGIDRLSGALRIWKEHEKEATSAFAKISYARFAEKWQPTSSLEDAVSAKEAGPETHLLNALQQSLDTQPGAIVCLTDGLDTTGEKADELVALAQQKAVPLYFVVGKNQTHGSESIDIREVKAPATALRNSQFTAGTLLEIASPGNAEIPCELWSGDRKLSETKLAVHTGLNTLPWTVTLNAEEPGPMPLEFRIGEGARQQIAGCTTQVVGQTTLQVLYYQGALQWGYRYLLAALQSDPSFQVSAILNPALGVKMMVDPAHATTFSDLPDNAKDLKRFQIVILAHVFAERITERQQKALQEYAAGGGGVLFIAPDSEATQQFAGTSLEKMLPVIFRPRTPESDSENATSRFRMQMSNSNIGGSDAFLYGTPNVSNLPTLESFTPPAGKSNATIARLFKDAESLPKFANHALVRGVKPGAEILAVTPTSDNRSTPEILLARQPFGAGFTATLTTDLLWRWKMSLPSSSQAVEKFWQQLLLSLAPTSGKGLRLVKLTSSPATRHFVQIRVEGSDSTNPPTVEWIDSSKERKTLVLQNTDNATDATWETSFVPPTAGRYEVIAHTPDQQQARLVFPVFETTRTTETLNLPPDTETLRQLAESTGGALIEDEPVFQNSNTLEKIPATKNYHPLWNSQWCLGLLLGLYGAELITRRVARLL